MCIYLWCLACTTGSADALINRHDSCADRALNTSALISPQSHSFSISNNYLSMLPLPPSTASSDGISSHDGVGLSDLQYSAGRRKMLDLVNRLHSTG